MTRSSFCVTLFLFVPLCCWTLFGVLGLDSLLAGTYLFGGRGSVENMKVSWLLGWNGKWSKGRFLTLVARRVRETRSLAGSPWGGVSRGCDVVVVVSPCLFVCWSVSFLCGATYLWRFCFERACLRTKKAWRMKKETMKLVKAPPLVEDSSTHKKLRSQLSALRTGVAVYPASRWDIGFPLALRYVYGISSVFLQAFFFSGLSVRLFTLFLRLLFWFFTNFRFHVVCVHFCSCHFYGFPYVIF